MHGSNAGPSLLPTRAKEIGFFSDLRRKFTPLCLKHQGRKALNNTFPECLCASVRDGWTHLNRRVVGKVVFKQHTWSQLWNYSAATKKATKEHEKCLRKRITTTNSSWSWCWNSGTQWEIQLLAEGEGHQLPSPHPFLKMKEKTAVSLNETRPQQSLTSLMNLKTKWLGQHTEKSHQFCNRIVVFIFAVITRTSLPTIFFLFTYHKQKTVFVNLGTGWEER